MRITGGFSWRGIHSQPVSPSPPWNLSGIPLVLKSKNVSLFTSCQISQEVPKKPEFVGGEWGRFQSSFRNIGILCTLFHFYEILDLILVGRILHELTLKMALHSRRGDFFSWPGGGGDAKDQLRNEQQRLGGVQKKISAAPALLYVTWHAPRNIFQSGGGGGGGGAKVLMIR